MNKNYKKRNGENKNRERRGTQKKSKGKEN